MFVNESKQSQKTQQELQASLLASLLMKNRLHGKIPGQKSPVIKKKRIARKLLKNTPRLVRISCLCWLKQKQIFLKVSDLKHSRTSDVKLGIKQWPWKCEGLGLICCFRTVRDAEINWTISSVIYIKPWPEPNWNAVA